MVQKNAIRRTIAPFHPNLKTIFSDKMFKPIYIKNDKRLSVLIHFLGYKKLRSSSRTYRTVNIMDLDARRNMLNNSLGFRGQQSRFLSLFYENAPFPVEVLNIILDRNMRYAIAQYYVPSMGSVNLAFYPVKLINFKPPGERPEPLTWNLFVY